MKIESFDGEYEFLSNFYYSPFYYNGILVNTVEHAYQGAKAWGGDDFVNIISCDTPGQAKRMGRKVKLPSDWEKVKESWMLIFLRRKFKRKDMRTLLKLTNDTELIEGNRWHDNEWGNCNCFKCKNIIGKNKLGILLMQVRDEIYEL